MIRSLAKSSYQFAKRSPLLRRIARTPLIARWKSRVAPWVLLGDSKYERWMARRLTTRHLDYPCRAESGLLSLLTTVWNTSPQYVQAVAESVLRQRCVADFEWIVIDNGSTKPDTRRLLEEIAASDQRVRLFRVEKNLGIVGGMRLALERATGRYVLPVDSDDWLYPDCLQVVTSVVQSRGYPAILYSDEDHLLGRKFVLPYFKPDWDPVLFQSCAYIAHLGVFDRRLALELCVYSDTRLDGCHDWDTFERFRRSGHVPEHIPEVLYSWRMHAGSTAANIRSKSYIESSHRRLLTGMLEQRGLSDRFTLRKNPLFHGTPDWHFQRRPVAPRPLLLIRVTDAPVDADLPGFRIDESGSTSVDADASASYPARVVSVPSDIEWPWLRNLVRDVAAPDGLVAFVSESVRIDDSGWAWEVLGQFELHADTAIVGGRQVNQRGVVIDAGRVFGFGGEHESPDSGRSVEDPGYYAQAWKPHSVSAVPMSLCVFDAAFLVRLLADFARPDSPPVSLANLGLWAGVAAARQSRRVIYSPFVSVTVAQAPVDVLSDSERLAFRSANSDLIPDQRYYPAGLSLDSSRSYELAENTPSVEAA
jgi:hypothetical protein